MAYSINTYKPSFMNKLSMFILALLPILAWYKIPFPLGLGYACILLLSSYSIVEKGFRINVLPKRFWLVWVYICFMWMYNHNFGVWTLFPPGGWIFFIFTLALLWGVIVFDLSLLKKYMRWVVIISGTLFWIQFALMISTGSPKFCFVPNLTGAFTYEDYSYADIVAKHMRGFPCSIFLEKSYLAYYFLTYLALVWFEKDNKRKNEIIFVIATLIACQSGTAVIGFLFLSIVKFFSVYRSIHKGRRVILLISIIPLILGGAYVYFNTELGQRMLSRTEEFSNEGTSGFSRVVGGYLIFEQLNFEEKLIGIPDPRSRYGIENADGYLRFYVNGIQTILIYLGYIGFLFYLFFYINVFRKVKITSKMCLVILLIMSFLESNYLNPYMMLLTIIPCSEVYVKKNC